MADAAEKGHQDARTPGSGGDQAPPADLPGADPLDLIAGLPDGEGDDVLALAAELVAAPSRARGRPQGAANRKNGDMIRYLQARGHRDPMVTLSMIQSADFGALCKAVGAETAKHKIAVLGIMRGAAADLLPYHHGKKPQQLELIGDGSKRPLMVIGEMNVAVAGDLGFMSAGIPPDAKIVENQPLSPAPAVRQNEDVSHDEANALNALDKTGIDN
ncbi:MULTISPECIES: hypothetical protein [unclassified Mesorhizobium]|uniref:hypothetical protein n=1 Tax=unclassified Mesorhizobium TaxID=325217 RepID=UPI001092B03B|nr:MULTISPECIES: hypothetical protein [unclassified Mesorhizobium]TGP93832.1 hypothetical protein EN861_17235 [Mesorhizobium sp. M8A.F.Ca.ET.218.01.1.1]TGT18128.1 hypothetical protein EN856_16760 [Mesorhizobium sp. M8A.F.Ca.ET.213.01.1.1]